MFTALAIFVSESSSRECSWMYLRAFQIATGSARFRELAFSNSAADNIFIILQNHLIVVRRSCCSWLGIFSPDFGINEKMVEPQPEQFLQSKTQGTWSTKSGRALLKPTKEQSMEYLILVAVVTMVALYALIIVGCVKQPEW